ncbi:Ctr copper transporter [Sistotremastrum niveocremeum HHB9708]|uniref:Copper transport protein n=1 Tax=Sistotremastrum niveocremeum HHB9708 TaxID=1314777 RepID=A0A164ZW80_9AGAM|nr:Ctr copper transporter [Sistotremastrum niveocremeum HHB9708]
MPTGPKCSMNMLWNTQIQDTCIVFRQWHISSTFIFILSFLTIVGLAVLYEWLRLVQHRIDVVIAKDLAKNKGIVSGSMTPQLEEETSLMGRPKAKSGTPIPLPGRLLRAATYGVSIFLSFFLMLVFMTYNAYLILAVVLGAAVGHYIFNADMDVDAVLYGNVPSKSVACH